MFGNYSAMTPGEKQKWAAEGDQYMKYDAYARDRDRESHERGLQMQEQKRRQYDSETAREMAGKKYDVLSGLLGGQMGGGSPRMASTYGWPFASGGGRMRRVTTRRLA